jgi:hypothetical protein
MLHLGRKALVQRRLKHSAMDVRFDAHFSQADSFAVVPEPTAKPSAWAKCALPTVSSLAHSSHAAFSRGSGVRAIQQLPFANSGLGVREVVISLLFVLRTVLDQPANQLEQSCDHDDSGRNPQSAWDSEKECATKQDETQEAKAPRQVIDQ